MKTITGCKKKNSKTADRDVVRANQLNHFSRFDSPAAHPGVTCSVLLPSPSPSATDLPLLQAAIMDNATSITADKVRGDQLLARRTSSLALLPGNLLSSSLSLKPGSHWPINPALLLSPLPTLSLTHPDPLVGVVVQVYSLSLSSFTLLEKPLSSVLILLDLSAAIDTVNHQILIASLQDLGVSGSALSLLSSYLNDHTHQVTWRGFVFEPCPLTTGVPQGSVLGPLLFSLYTNSLGFVIHSHGTQQHRNCLLSWFLNGGTSSLMTSGQKVNTSSTAD